jgi:hypothetical protein
MDREFQFTYRDGVFFSYKIKINRNIGITSEDEECDVYDVCDLTLGIVFVCEA